MIVIKLSNLGGELGRYELPSEATEEDISYALSKLLKHTWVLAVGDTITVTEE